MNIRTLLFLCILYSPLALTAQADTAWRTYKHAEGFYSLKHPPAWTVRKDESNRVFFTSPLSNDADGFRDNVNISTSLSNDFKNLKLTEDADAIIGQLAAGFPDFELLEKLPWSQGGIKGLQLIYKAKPEGAGDLDLLFIQRFFLKGLRLYTITFSTLSSDQTFRQAGIRLLDSIRFQ